MSTIRENLEAPFTKEQIKHRPGHFGQSLAYVEGHAVIRRLNEAFDGAWSFELVEHQIRQAEVLVVGKLTCPLGAKMAFGGSAITVNKDTGEVVSIVDDLKAAATDALKKGATLLGVALHLYEDTEPAKDGRCNVAPNPAGQSGDGNGAGRVTAKQLAYLYAMLKAKGLVREDLQRLSVARFNKMPDFISKEQASELIQELQQQPAA
jgi:hypothetical protein